MRSMNGNKRRGARVLDVDIPWMIGANAPSDDAFVAMVDVEPSTDHGIHGRLAEQQVRAISLGADRERFAARAKRWSATSERRRRASNRRSTLLLKPDQPVLTEKTLPIR